MKWLLTLLWRPYSPLPSLGGWRFAWRGRPLQAAGELLVPCLISPRGRSHYLTAAAPLWHGPFSNN